MRTEERLLIIAINEIAVNTVVEILHTLAGEYIEGQNETAGIIFNKYFPKLYPEMQKKYIHTSPFERHANKLAEKYNIAKPWREKGQYAFEWEYKGFERNPHLGYVEPKLNGYEDAI